MGFSNNGWSFKDLLNIDVDTSSKKYSNTDNRDYSSIYSPTYNLNSAGASGSNITTKKEAVTTTTQSDEKPISFAPALLGGGTTTATGEGSATSTSSILPILLIAGAVGVGFIFIGGKKK